MELDELINRVAAHLENEDVAYFVFGGVALGVWADARVTADLDLVVMLDRGALSDFVSGLNREGFRIGRSLSRKLMEGRIIQAPIGRTRLDIKLASDVHDLSALGRAISVPWGTRLLRVATPEDLVLYKLKSWRRIDQADVERILAEVEDLDEEYIDSMLDLIEDVTGAPMRDRWGSIR